MMRNANEPAEIFISYSHKDEDLYQQLLDHLRPLKNQRLVNIWSDRDIAPGTQLTEEIEVHLNKAQIILLLISPAFMASDYCYNVEMKRAMSRHVEGEARVIPIILRPVDWQRAPLGMLQALPKDGKPITYWHDEDEAFHSVVRDIEYVVLTLEKSARHESAYAIETRQFAPPVRAQMSVPSASELLALFTDLLVIIFTFLRDLGRRLLVGFYHGFALISRACGVNALALRASEHAIDLEQNLSRLPRLYLVKGQALFNLKRYPEALDAYGTAILFDPNLSQAYRARGKVYEHLAQQSFDESRRIFKEADEKAKELGSEGTSKQ